MSNYKYRSLDFEKYYGKKKYKDAERELRYNNMQKEFSENEKIQILRDILEYIDAGDYDLYHDLMDNLLVEKNDWFNMLCFDGKAKKFVLTYIKSRVQEKGGKLKISKERIIDESCYNTDEPLPRNCSTCEFNFGNVCAGYGTRTDNGEYTYGMNIEMAEDMFPQGCKDYGLSLSAFTIIEERAEMT